MRRLFDNYELDTHAIEHVTPEEEQEELDFLTAILDTPIMKKTMQFLEFKGECSIPTNIEFFTRSTDKTLKA